MANYYMNISHGIVGKGLPHSEYILGQGKYQYKDQEVKYVSNNLPSWSNDENEFWKMADLHERMNGRSYTELKLSLPNDLDLEQNINLLEEFLDETFKGKFYYTASIHDKESSYEKGTQNIHAHIMFSERKLDNLERNKNTFFKRYNTKNPSKGGCKKDRYWKNKNKLLELRKSWEILQNNYLEQNNINTKVSCETLEKQREIALDNNDTLKAELLKRAPINLSGHLIHKKNRTPEEENKYQIWIETRELKSLKEEVFDLKLQKLKEAKSEKQSQKNKNSKVNFPKVPFSELLDMKNNIELMFIEVEKTKFDIENIDQLINKEVSPELFSLGIKLERAFDDNNLDKIELLETKSLELQNKINPNLIDKTKEIILNKLNNRIETLENNISIYNIKYKEELNKIDDQNIVAYSKLQSFESNKDKYIKYLDLNKKLDVLIKNQSKNMSLNTKDKIGITAINILTKNKYSKLLHRKENLKFKISKMKQKIVWCKDPSKNIILKKELKVMTYEFDKISENFKILEKITKSNSFKNKKIRLEISIKKKLDKQESNNLYEQYSLNKEIEILKPQIDLIRNKKVIISDRLVTLYSKKREIKRIIALNKDKATNSAPTYENVEIRAYNELTGGMSNDLISLYTESKIKLDSFSRELSELTKINFFKKSKLNKEIEILKNNMNRLETENIRLKELVPKEVLYEKIIEIKNNDFENYYKNLGLKIDQANKLLFNKLEIIDSEIKSNQNLKVMKEDKNEFNQILKISNKKFKEFQKDYKNQVSKGKSTVNIWKKDRDKELDDGFEL